MDKITVVGAAHPTSGLAGFPARDYLGPGGQVFRAPFNGCVPPTSERPWGWARLQDPANGFGGMRIYLENGANHKQTYMAHAGFLYLQPGECFKQGDPVGRIWHWPNNEGRSHSHLGYQGGDPLTTLIDRAGRFLIVYTPAKADFPKPRMILEGTKWIVRVGKKVVYKGGRAKASTVYGRQKKARRINLFWQDTFPGSPLVGHGLMFVQVAYRPGYRVDPRFEAAIASCETSAGTQGGGPKVHNPFGLLHRGHHRKFGSWKDAVIYLSHLLRTQYLDKGLDTVPEIGAKYAPVGASNDPRNKNSRWVGCVTKFYKRMGGTNYLPVTVLPELRKVDVVAKTDRAKKEGRWQCFMTGKGVLYQSTYKPTKAFCADKQRYWKRQR